MIRFVLREAGNMRMLKSSPYSKVGRKGVSWACSKVERYEASWANSKVGR